MTKTNPPPPLSDIQAGSAKPLKEKPLRLEFLDGLRGLAALYVVIYHLAGESDNLLPQAIRGLMGWAKYGHSAVDIFIILSGYCLMLPVAQASGGWLRGGMMQFFRRRARRILPPYYAAFTLALLLNSFQLHGLKPHLVNPKVSPGNFFTHLFLAHNWTIWSNSLDAPLWSVATEWQIYFFFPILLLPLWRRYGIILTIACGFGIGFLPHLLLPAAHNFDGVAPWFLGLFALGMAGAVIKLPSVGLFSLKQMLAIGILLSGLCTAIWGTDRFMPENYPVLDPLTGLLTVFVIILLARQSAIPKPSPILLPVLQILQSRLAIFLGAISYSLYLTHMLAMLKVYPAIQALHLTGTNEFFFRLCFCIPWTVLFAYLFFLAFERPFLSRRRNASSAEFAPAITLSPAP